MSSPLLHAGPAVGWDTPFEMLLACHERVERMLRLLQRLHQHLNAQGNSEAARQAARDVMRYFDLAGPAHHADEERHLFPLLRAQGPAAVQAVVRQLAAEHQAMTLQWAALRADLQQVAEGVLPLPPAAELGARWTAFAALYRAHIVLEEAQAYPAARALLGEPALAAMGGEMAHRRGLR
jgi:hemerythrin-like domain-containing protein